jgi:hypothetical protein
VLSSFTIPGELADRMNAVGLPLGSWWLYLFQAPQFCMAFGTKGRGREASLISLLRASFQTQVEMKRGSKKMLLKDSGQDSTPKSILGSGRLDNKRKRGLLEGKELP